MLRQSNLSLLDVLQLFLGHSEIMSEFVDDRPPDLFPHFRLVVADGLNVLLIEHDVVRPRRQPKNALVGHWHAMEKTEAQRPWLAGLGWFLVGRKVFNQHGDISDAPTKLPGQRVHHFRDYFAEVLARHAPSTDTFSRALRKKLLFPENFRSEALQLR